MVADAGINVAAHYDASLDFKAAPATDLDARPRLLAEADTVQTFRAKGRRRPSSHRAFRRRLRRGRLVVRRLRTERLRARRLRWSDRCRARRRGSGTGSRCYCVPASPVVPPIHGGRRNHAGARTHQGPHHRRSVQMSRLLPDGSGDLMTVLVAGGRSARQTAITDFLDWLSTHEPALRKASSNRNGLSPRMRSSRWRGPAASQRSNAPCMPTLRRRPVPDARRATAAQAVVVVAAVAVIVLARGPSGSCICCRLIEAPGCPRRRAGRSFPSCRYEASTGLWTVSRTSRAAPRCSRLSRHRCLAGGRGTSRWPPLLPQ